MISWTDQSSMMLPEDPLHPVPWTRMDELLAKLRIDVPISQPDSNDYRITLHCFNKETSALKNALIMTSRIEWKSPKTTVFFNAFHADLLSIVNECLSTHKFQIFTKRNCIYKWKSPEQLVEHEISYVLSLQIGST